MIKITSHLQLINFTSLIVECCLNNYLIFKKSFYSYDFLCYNYICI